MLRGRSGIFASLSNPQFRWFMVSLGAAGMAFQSQMVVRGWLAYDLTRSPLAVGIVVVAWGIPMLLVTPFGGLLADQMNRRRMMMATQAVSGVTALAIAVLITTGHVSLWHLVVGGIVDGTAVALDMPSRNAFVFDVAGKEHIASAIGLTSVSMNVNRLMAPSVAGVLIGGVGVETVYYIIVACYFTSVATVFSRVGDRPRENKGAGASAMGDMARGFSYVWRDRAIFWLLVLSLSTGMLGLAFRNLMPAFAVEVLGQGPLGYGLLMSMVGVGSLLGSMLIAGMGSFRHRGLLLIALGIAWGLSLVAFSLSTSMAMAMPLLLILGVTSIGFNSLNHLLVQVLVEDEIRGRVLSIFMISFAVNAVGTLPVSWVAEVLGTGTALVLSGLALFLIGATLGLWRRDLRRLA